MNEKTLDLLSAYLDGEVNPRQKKEVEKMLKTDDAIRAEYEEMRKFAAAISSSRPAEINAPEGFRTRIMDRLQNQNPGNDSPPGGSKGKGGGSQFYKRQWMSYLAAGSVLVGLTSVFIYNDYSNQQKINRTQQLVKQVIETNKTTNIDMPEYKGKQSNTKSFTTASPSDIQNTVKAQISNVNNKNPDNLEGRIYTRGQGTVGSKNSKIGYIENKRLILESNAGWNKKIINEKIIQIKLYDKITAQTCMTLAEKNNINPGLILSVIQLKPESDILDLVGLMRRKLNQNSTLPDEERLEQLIKAMNGKNRWKEIIRNNLTP